MNNYEDDPDADAIKQRLSELEYIGDVKDYANEIYPGWIITAMDEFCPDYPHFTTNWKICCEKANVQKAQILIVDELSMDKKHTVVSMFAEIFTTAGFIVRRKREFIPCRQCNKAIPSELYYHIIKDSKHMIEDVHYPRVWMPVCSNCN